MGSECNLHFYHEGWPSAVTIARLAIAEVKRIEDRYSRYREGNLLYGINQAAHEGKSIAVDEETAMLLTYAEVCFEKSNGFFDITSGILRKAWNFTSGALPSQKTIDALLPKIGFNKLAWRPPLLTFSIPGMELDLGGIVKEYAADRVNAVCAGNNVSCGLVELGGDICIFGPHPGGNPWSINIRNPHHHASATETVEISKGALATSGDYERCIERDGKRYSHLLNPQTGHPVFGLSSVSVVANHCMVAGSISTIAMLKGKEGKSWLEKFARYYLWIDGEGQNGGTLFRENEMRVIPS